MSDALKDRERSLEETFFGKVNAELLEKLRADAERSASREALARVSGIADAEVLDKLLELGIGPDTWTALSLVPLVEVAWANGQVDAKERRAVLAGAQANGITVGSPAWSLLESWLARRPDGRLLRGWGEYVVALCARLSPGEKTQLREQVLGRAHAVAEATGGFLGLGDKISSEERVVLDELAKAFEG
jgi:hypothetical protein